MASLIISRETIIAQISGERIELVQGCGEGQERIVAPLYDIERVCVVGRPSITFPLLYKLMQKNIPVTFLSTHGRWIGGLYSFDQVNAERRIQQYELFKNMEKRLIIAKQIVFAKIKNSRRVIQRLAAARKLSDDPVIQISSLKLKRLAVISKHRAKNLDALRGYEGMAAAIYFERLAQFFPEEIPFVERSRQPPRNAANAILSWSYAIVQGEIDGVLRKHGLDVYIGILHTISHSMPSLALDILEPLRAPLCDMLTLHLLNHKILQKSDFEFNSEDGGTYLKPDSRKIFFTTYEQTMTRKFSVPGYDYHLDFRKIIELQVFYLLKILEGKDDENFFFMP